ncbi:hypothetical protein [Nostoc sp.]
MLLGQDKKVGRLMIATTVAVAEIKMAEMKKKIPERPEPIH